MRYCLFATVALLVGAKTTLFAAYPVVQDSGSQTRLEQIKLMISNQESELRTFEQKLESLDLILDSLRDQIRENASQHKDLVKGVSTSHEAKTAALESKTTTLANDIKSLHQHASDTASTLTLFKQKIAEIEQRQNAQAKNIEHLQSGLQSILEALQIKTDAPATTHRTYKIKNGDSLDKIAKMHNTTISAIKELNGINSDKIVVGKTLKIPDAP